MSDAWLKAPYIHSSDMTNKWSLEKKGGHVLQRFAGWLAQICDENSRMCGIFNSRSPHAQIFVANLCQQTSVFH